MAMKQGVLLFALLSFTTAQGPEPRIVTRSNLTSVSDVGGIVSLSCEVEHIGTHKLNWVFVKHGTTIFHGSELMVDDSRYTMNHAPDSKVYLLQILFVREEDQGVYRCEVDGTNQAITINLELQGAPVSPALNSTQEPLNHTSCCQRLNVSEACQPACYPSTAGNNSYVEACSLDISKLIQCGTDGRNHEDCCARSGVPANCLMFCSNDLSSLGIEQQVCLSHVDAIISCYEYGGALLPSPPQMLSVISKERNGSYSLLLTWQPPMYNPDAVSGYRVHYKKATDAKYRASNYLNAATNKYSVSVDVSTAYSVYVVALGHHGSSQPTNTISIVVDSTSQGSGKDVLSCCQKRNVSPKCQTSLCHPRVWAHFDVYSNIECYNYLTDIFTCLVGERDHSECCVVNNVPAECVGMCRGQPPPDNTSSLAMCLPKLSVMEACVQSGLSDQPIAPQGVTLAKVEDHSVIVEWTAQANDTGSAPVQEYYVQLRRGSENSSWTNVAEVVGTFVQLTNLTETENYAVRVIAVTANSSSLPSAIIRFTTYPEYQEPLRPTVAHNLTQCCVDSGMPSLCSAGCQYQAGMTLYYASVLSTCEDHIGTVLTCAADGRDHTACCEQRQVQSGCLSLCAYNAPGALVDSALHNCISDTASILQCYEEGLEDLVRMPEEVEVRNVSSHSISLVWKNPETGPTPQLYLVTLTNVLQGTKQQRNTTSLMYILQNLAPGTKYEMTVASLLNDTSSPPTNPITEFTLDHDSNSPFIPQTPTNMSRALWTNRTHCCQSGSISVPCQDVCMNRPAPNATDCSSENQKILACAGNGGDHSLCCRMNGLPEDCISLCQGHMANFSVHYAPCLAEAGLSIIMNCFLDNAGLLPSAPYNFHVRNEQGSIVTARWERASNCHAPSDPCTYDLHYWPSTNSDPSVYTTVNNVRSPWSVKGLMPDQHYTFTVTARNSYGSGAPAPWVTLFVADITPVVAIAQAPKLQVFDKGSTVYLTCDVFNLQAAPRFTWRLRSHQLQSQGRVLTLTNIKETSEGNYSCTVEAGKVSISDTRYLNVRYKPVHHYTRTDSVPPFNNEEAVMACWFRGHPDTDNPRAVWTKDGQPIRFTSRHSASVKSRYHTGITAFKLKIAYLVPQDYGKYQCNVSNHFGFAVSHTNLMDPRKIPPEVTPTPQQKQNVSNCCRARGVISDCLPLCSMEVSAAEAITNPNKYGVCLFFFSDLIECAADGADHTLCCVHKVIPDLCLSFCKGQVPPVANIFNAPELLQCVPETPDILDCMDKGYEKIPTAPQNVVASLVGEKIKVAWDLPKRNGHHVSSYHIYYNFTGNPVYQLETVSALVGRSHVLENANDDHEYYIWMTSERYKFGMSQISNVVKISPKGGHPLAPKNLQVQRIEGTSVTVSWEPPAPYADSEAYAVYYKRINDIREKKEITTKTQITLRGLRASSEYQVYVVSRNIDGEGPNSEIVKFYTGLQDGTPAADKVKQSADSGLGGGQVAGIVLAVLAVIGVIIVLAVLLYRSRVQKPAVTESVSFQNPTYGNEQVQINDLPSTDPYDNVMQPPAQAVEEEVGSFSYARLQEDPVPMPVPPVKPPMPSKTATDPDPDPALDPVTDPDPAADPGHVSVDVSSNGVANLEPLEPDLKSESTT